MVVSSASTTGFLGIKTIHFWSLRLSKAVCVSGDWFSDIDGGFESLNHRVLGIETIHFWSLRLSKAGECVCGDEVFRKSMVVSSASTTGFLRIKTIHFWSLRLSKAGCIYGDWIFGYRLWFRVPQPPGFWESNTNLICKFGLTKTTKQCDFCKVLSIR